MTMIIRTVFIVCLLSLTHSGAESVLRGGVPNEWKDRRAPFATKDDIRDVLERMKIQEQRISNLEKEVKVRDKALVDQSAAVMKLEKIVQQQSQRISKLELDARGINVKLKEILRSFEEKCNINCCKFDGTVSNNSNAYSHPKDSKATLPLKSEEAVNKANSGQMEKKRLQGRGIKRDHFPKRATTAHASFSVYLSHLQEHLGAYQVVKFDGVITNDGNAYNSHTGVFTVPMTGTYFFIFYVSSSTSNVEFYLMVDDDLKACGFARPSAFGQSKDVQGGGTVILKLNQGVSVWIENRGNDCTVFSDYYHRWVTFSGFLMY